MHRLALPHTGITVLDYIWIERIHYFKSIYWPLLNSYLCIFILSCHYIADELLPNEGYVDALHLQLNDFEIWKFLSTCIKIQNNNTINTIVWHQNIYIYIKQIICSGDCISSFNIGQPRVCKYNAMLFTAQRDWLSVKYFFQYDFCI